MKTPFNPRAIYNKDARRLFSGKDAVLFDADGTLLSTVDTFNATINFATAQYQPLGSPLQQAFLTGYSVTIEMTNCIVESEKFLLGAADFFINGRHAPSWTFQSVLNGYEDDDNEERLIWRDCVPSGNWNIANFTIGDIIKRTLSLTCNQAPELQKLLGTRD